MELALILFALAAVSFLSGFHLGRSVRTTMTITSSDGPNWTVTESKTPD